MTKKEIGKKAELTVHKKIEKTLRDYNDEYEIFDNLIVPFSSLFGSDINMTTEIDILVLTHYFIFVFEVKSISSFKYRTNKFFKTDKTYIINPEKQNQTHRYALSEYLNIDCKNIVQIETLKKIPSKSEIENVVYSTVDNDYKLIYTQRNFNYELLNILNNTQKIDYDYYSIKTKLKELKENEANSLEKHIKNIEDMRIKINLLNKQAKYYDISDSGLCPYCRQQSIKIQLNENKLMYICKNIKCEKYNQTIEKVEASKLLINNNKKTLKNSKIKIYTIEERIQNTKHRTEIEDEMYKEIVQEQEEQIEQLKNMVDLLRVELQNKNKRIQQFEEEKEKYSKIFKLRKYIVVKENDK